MEGQSEKLEASQAIENRYGRPTLATAAIPAPEQAACGMISAMPIADCRIGGKEGSLERIPRPTQTDG